MNLSTPTVSVDRPFGFEPSADCGRLPSVSFVIPTLNASKYLRQCLGSISSQDYPLDKREIIVVDGGSVDDTTAIARSHRAKVLPNVKRLAEPGVDLGVRQSQGSLVVVLAADNELPVAHWLRSMTVPFLETKNVVAAFPFPEPAPDDTPMNRYYCHIMTDPLTFFVFNSFGNRLRSYIPVSSRPTYDVFLFPKEDIPLIGVAQGFVLRRDFAPASLAYDDVAPFCELIMKGYEVALVRSVGIYHRHLENLSSFLKKYLYRAQIRIRRSQQGRYGLMNQKRRFRIRLWLLYSLTAVGPMLDSAKGYRQDPDTSWFYHPIACFLMTVVNFVVGLQGIRSTLELMRS